MIMIIIIIIVIKVPLKQSDACWCLSASGKDFHSVEEL